MVNGDGSDGWIGIWDEISGEGDVVSEDKRVDNDIYWRGWDENFRKEENWNFFGKSWRVNEEVRNDNDDDNDEIEGIVRWEKEERKNEGNN